VYGGGISLGNGADWVALRDGAGRTVDSVAWSAARRGTAMARVDLTGGARPASTDTREAPVAVRAPRSSRPLPTGASPLVVRVLDVGQGDAILVENGGSRALIDGGPDPDALGRHLDALGLDGQTIDVVVMTHGHLDHYNGLRELFRARRRIGVRYVFDARDPSPNRTLATLRDSVASRARRGALEWRDADDPCGDGGPTCTVTLRGGARLVILRPWPSDTAGPNNRSVAVRLVSADSSFTMWLAGDAEREAIAWMERSGYPLRADVLKANHHGSCDGMSPSYLRRVAPSLAVMALASPNDYGYVHAQTTDMLRDAGVPWLRTDRNGTITITAPGRDGEAWSVATERGGRNEAGPSDRAARDPKCRR
jgi:competence protein ComEC